MKLVSLDEATDEIVALALLERLELAPVLTEDTTVEFPLAVILADTELAPVLVEFVLAVMLADTELDTLVIGAE